MQDIDRLVSYFEEPPNVAVFTTSEVVHGSRGVRWVEHADEDGSWVFLDDEESSDQLLVVALQTILRLDPSLVDLADLPLGWTASRKQPGAKWVRRRA